MVWSFELAALSHADEAVPRLEQQLMSAAHDPVAVPASLLPPLLLPPAPASNPHWLEHAPVAAPA